MRCGIEGGRRVAAGKAAISSSEPASNARNPAGSVAPVSVRGNRGCVLCRGRGVGCSQQLHSLELHGIDEHAFFGREALFDAACP